MAVENEVPIEYSNNQYLKIGHLGSLADGKAQSRHTEYCIHSVYT